MSEPTCQPEAHDVHYPHLTLGHPYLQICSRAGHSTSFLQSGAVSLLQELSCLLRFVLGYAKSDEPKA